MNNIKNKRIIWIDYFKIFACIMVFVGHYYNAFYSFCNILPNLNHYVVVFFEKFPAPFLDGNFWVCVFCILSGYLSSKKNISSMKQLSLECILRYFRFLIPLLFVNISVYLVNIVFGFKSTELSLLYNNNWLGSFFKNITLIGALKNTITLGSQLNGPLWMIRPLFLGNILILCANYMKNKLKNHTIIKIILLSTSLLITIFVASNYELFLYTFVTLLGLIISHITNRIKIRYNYLFLLFWLIFIHIFYTIPLAQSIIRINGLSLLNTLSAFIFVLTLFFCKDMDSLKKNKLDLGSISFYIYLIHWPIICSLSCELIMLFDNYTMGYISVLLITSATVFIISYILSITINKAINLSNIKIKKILCKILKYNE